MTKSVIANLFATIGECSDYLNGKGAFADTARAVLKLTARDDYNEVNDIVLIGAPDEISDGSGTYGAVSAAISDVANGGYIRNAYVIPTADGKVSCNDAEYTPNMLITEVTANHIYKVIPTAAGQWGELSEVG